MILFFVEAVHHNTPFLCSCSSPICHILAPTVAPPVKKMFPPLIKSQSSEFCAFIDKMGQSSLSGLFQFSAGPEIDYSKGPIVTIYSKILTLQTQYATVVELSFPCSSCLIVTGLRVTLFQMQNLQVTFSLKYFFQVKLHCVT